MNRLLTISFGRAENLAHITRVQEMSWDAFAAMLTAPAPETEDKASPGWYACAEFNPVYRDGENFVARHCLTFDFDKITKAEASNILSKYSPYAHVVYKTHSSTTEAPRLRVVMPLSRPASFDEFSAVSRQIANIVGIELAARESHVPAQCMFLPAVKPGTKFMAKVNEGQWINVDAVLEEFENWTNRESWPRRAEGDGTHKGDVQCPPNEKPGIVGDFCRAYSVTEAIQTFGLPYEPTENPDRWTYTKGTRREGAIVYDGGQKLHSHHDSDPARGQHNSFDLVRLHRFAGKDAAIEGGAGRLPLADQPSFHEMVAFARADKRVARAGALAEFKPLPVLTDGELARPADGLVAEQDSHFKWIHDVINKRTFARWLIKHMLEWGVISILVGPRGVFKSFVAIEWAFRVAELGLPVVVISAEGSDYGRRAQARIMYHTPDKQIEDFPLLLAETRINFATDGDVDGVVAEVNRLLLERFGDLAIKPALVVLDTYSKLTGGLDENDNSQVKEFVGRLDRKLKRRWGATLLMVAHTGHSDASRPRGASALAADTDEEHLVGVRGNLISVSNSRFKGSPEFPPTFYEKIVIKLGYVDEDGEEVTSLALKEIKPVQVEAEQPAKKLTSKQQKVYNVLKRIHPVGPIPKRVAINAVVDAAVVESKADATLLQRQDAAWKRIGSLVDDKVVFKQKDQSLMFIEGVVIPEGQMDNEND